MAKRPSWTSTSSRPVPAVMQAPLGPAATTELVASVSAAGGLGCLAASWTPPKLLRAQVRAIARAVDRPYCVNLVLAFDQAERLELLLEEDVPVISFSWGVDADAIALARDAGVTVLVQVAGAEQARSAVAAGADVLIAQGVEAGGHVQSRTPLLHLLRDVRSAVPTPILAAGGIVTAAAADEARAGGADGVVAGTAYLAAEEADVHPHYREWVLAAAGEDTVLTGLFDVGWPDAPHRVLRNPTTEAHEDVGERPGEGDVVATRFGRPIVRYSDAQPTRDTEGDVGAMALYAGLGVGDVRAVEGAAEITERLTGRTSSSSASRSRPR